MLVFSESYLGDSNVKSQLRTIGLHQWFSNLIVFQNHAELCPTLRVSNAIHLGWGPKICISNVTKWCCCCSWSWDHTLGTTVLAENVIAGESRLRSAVFWPPLGHIRMDLGLGPLPYQEIKSSYSLCCLITFDGSIFLCFRFNEHSFVCLNCMWHMRPGLSHCHIHLLWGGTGFLPLWQVNYTVLASWRDPLLPRGDQLPILKAAVALSLPWANRALLHPVFDCIASSLAIPISRRCGQKCLDSCLGLVTGTQYSVQQ